MTNHYRLVAVIFHTMIYRNGELIAIIPNGNTAAWARLTSEMIDENAEVPF